MTDPTKTKNRAGSAPGSTGRAPGQQTRRARRQPSGIDDPGRRRGLRLRSPISGDSFGRAAEGFARFMGTPAFLVGMTVFCALWLAWNTFLPTSMQFDPRSLNFTLLTLILSLQASYAAPLLLLSDNRQADRDRVQAEQDRQSNDRNHATTDFITREIATLRLALNDMATRDFVRGELRDLLEEMPRSAPEAGAASEQPLADPEALRALLREEIAAALAVQRPGQLAPPPALETPKGSLAP